MKYLKCLFWNLYYKIKFSIKGHKMHGDDLLKYIKRTSLFPKTFKPYIWKNPDSPQYHIYFSDEMSYTERRWVLVDAHIGQDSKRIVGITIHEQDLD